MAPRPSPTARRVRLGTELRKLRERAGLTATEAAQLLGTSSGQLSNVESARFGVSPDRVRAMANLYSCTNQPHIDALVDMAAWHWMYDHPQAKPEELKQAVLQISKDVWNKYYAPVFNKKDVVLLGVYSHMIDSFLYLPDYPIGHLIAHQIEEQIRKTGAIGPEFERMAKMGNVTPDLWMRNATGAPVGPEALFAATERALAALER